MEALTAGWLPRMEGQCRRRTFCECGLTRKIPASTPLSYYKRCFNSEHNQTILNLTMFVKNKLLGRSN
jgi:hypothetical protein